MFVRAPHPFGWLGIDHYHDLAVTLAGGGGFSTTDVPPGYVVFVAAVYRVFGARPWVPLLLQVLLNATIPLLLFDLVRRQLGVRIAVWAALLAGICSFNTVYASTLAADSICTVVFLASLVLFARGLDANRSGYFAVSGAMAGVAAQMRPNLVLFPLVLVGVSLLALRHGQPQRGKLALYLALVVATILPWTIHNWRLTGELMPTSSHGGTQLWYGTLQTGPYLKSRAENPRSIFEAPSFDYSSLDHRSLIVDASAPCAPASARHVLKYWTDQDRTPRQAEPLPRERSGATRFVLPGQPIPTALYYYLETTTTEAPSRFVNTPPAGSRDPFVFLVDDRHLMDLDRHGDLLDAFDLVRALRAVAWREPAADPKHHDVRRLVALLLDPDGRLWPDDRVVTNIRSDANEAVLELVDGSSFSVPRRWSGSITEVSATGGLAAALCHAHRTWSSLEAASRVPVPFEDRCLAFDRVVVNEVFYRAEPHMMHRYMALASDNIRRDPASFALASLYRFGRLFVVEGTGDRHVAHQFDGSRVTYAAATAASLGFLVLAAAGVAIAVRRHARVWLLLTPIVYIPATICFVLTNQRYTVTVQPLMFAFCAVALAAAWERRHWD